MILSTTTAMLTAWRGKNVLDGLRILGDAGFSHVDLGFHLMFGEGGLLSGDDWQENVCAMRETIAQCRLTPTQSHAAFSSALKPWYLVESERLKLQSRIARCLRAAGMLGVPAIVVHPVCAASTEGKTLAETVKINRRFFGDLLPPAEENHVALAFENLFVGEFTSAQALKELLSAFDGANVGYCLDVGHAHLTGQNLPETIRAMGDRLLCVHIHDNDGQKDNHLPPFQGNIDWATVAPALKTSGYRGDFTLEVEARAVPQALYRDFAAFARKTGLTAMNQEEN